MDVQRSNKQLVCVEYPGIVKNVEKMMSTFGGESALSKAYSNSSARLEVRFRPDDIFSKPCNGDRFNTTNMLMKVVRRRLKGQDPSQGVVVRVEILGTINTTYKFRGLADYQYLPMTRTSDEKYESLLPQLIPCGMEVPDWYKEEVPIFIQPAMFSRLDQPTNYHFRKPPQQRKPEESDPPNIIGRSRRKRTAYTMLLGFEDKEIPSKPLQAALEQLESRRVDIDLVEILRKIFEERPVWSKNALAGYAGLDKARLKFALPVVAYYLTTGPWRSSWVRFNFDPKKEPIAKQYQILDFRIHRKAVSDKFMKQAFRRPMHTYRVATKIGTVSRVGLIHTPSLTQTTDTGDQNDKRDISTYVFRPGWLPAFRQTFYHLCDIGVDEVQLLVSENDGREPEECHEKDGWCLPGVMDQCREILYTEVIKTITALKQETSEGNEDTQFENDSDEEDDENILSSSEEDNMEID